MLGVGETLPKFKIVGVKPRFMRHEEKGENAFESRGAQTDKAEEVRKSSKLAFDCIEQWLGGRIGGNLPILVRIPLICNQTFVM